MSRNEIVDMMKSEAGKLRLRVVKRDIVAFIREIYVTFNEYARQKNIELTFGSEVESASVAFDGRQLEKVFFNLPLSFTLVLLFSMRLLPGWSALRILVRTVVRDAC